MEKEDDESVTVGVIHVRKCGECPHVEKGRTYSLDGFDRGSDWTCSKTGTQVGVFIERASEEPKQLPPNCPLPKLVLPKG
jgi:hypothetical protein